MFEARETGRMIQLNTSVGGAVMVRVAHITLVAEGLEDSHAYVSLLNGEILEVNETYKQIIDALKGDDDA